jgi:hypothetical protein
VCLLSHARFARVGVRALSHAQAYQSAELAARANVSSGDGVRLLVDVTSDVSASLVVNNTQLAAVVPGNGTGATSPLLVYEHVPSARPENLSASLRACPLCEA